MRKRASIKGWAEGSYGHWVTDYGLARYDRRLARWYKCHARSPAWVPVPGGHEYHRRQQARRGRNRRS